MHSTLKRTPSNNSVSSRRTFKLNKSVKNGTKEKKEGLLKKLQERTLTREPQVKYALTFEENYHAHNKTKLIEALKMSGIYKINKDKAYKFINSQITPLRRRAAKDLIDNTHYITLKESFNIIDELIIKTYKDIDKYYSAEDRPNIYMYCGPNNKSFYFFSCIAMYCIEKYNKNNTKQLQIPIFIDRINTDFLLNLRNDTLIIVDDVSYSGSQLAKMLDGYHYRICIQEGRPPPNIYALITALNDFSLARLSKISLARTERGTVIKEGPTPFKIMYLKERLYKPLVKVIGIERYFYINLFFNTWLSNDTHLAMYLDHKVADITSTFKNTYVYGPIVPATYDIKFSNDYLLNEVYSYRILNDQENDKLLKAFLKESPDYTPENRSEVRYSTELRGIRNYLSKKAIQEVIDHPESPYFNQKINDVIGNESNTDIIRFIPFIDVCNKSKELKKIIENREIQEMDYTFFMADPEVNLQLIEELIDVKNVTLENIMRIINVLDSYRCPKHWYKDPTHPLKLM